MKHTEYQVIQTVKLADKTTAEHVLDRGYQDYGRSAMEFRVRKLREMGIDAKLVAVTTEELEVS